MVAFGMGIVRVSTVRESRIFQSENKYSIIKLILRGKDVNVALCKTHSTETERKTVRSTDNYLGGGFLDRPSIAHRGFRSGNSRWWRTGFLFLLIRDLLVRKLSSSFLDLVRSAY